MPGRTGVGGTPDTAAQAEAATLWELPYRLRMLAGSRRFRRVAFGVAFPFFVVGLGMTWERAGLSLGRLEGAPLSALVVLMFCSVGVGAWQFRAVAQSVQVSTTWRYSLRVVSLGALSGMLPVSSGLMVRGSALLLAGASPGSTGRAFAFDALVWVGLAALCSGFAATVAAPVWLAAGLLGAGVLFLGAAIVTAHKAIPTVKGLQVAAARLAGFGLEIMRLAASFAALGHSISLRNATILASAHPFSSLLFILPGSLGVSEAFAAALAGPISVGVAVTFVAAALNRFVAVCVVLVAAGGESADQLFRGRKR